MHVGWVRAGGYVQEKASTTISGLTSGKKYKAIFYAQGGKYTGPYAIGGGRLEIRINGALIDNPLFPDSEWDTDSWRRIEAPFTATGSTATLELAGAEHSNINFQRGVLYVDGGGPGSVVEDLPTGDLEMVKVINNINGNATIPNPAVVNAGNAVEFEIRIKNNGPNDMNGIKVKDLIPDGYSYLNHATIDGTYNSTTGIWDVGGSPSGGVPNGWTRYLYIRTTAKPTGNHTNTATVEEYIGTDPNTGNNSASASVTVRPHGDLEVTKIIHKINGSTSIPNPAVANAGDTVEFELFLKNNGPNDMTGVKVKDLLPSGYTYVSHNVTDGTYNPTTGIWDVEGPPSGGVPNGWTRHMYITGTVNATGNYTNTATINSFDGTDPNNGNNTATASVTVNACTNPTAVSISPASQTVAQNGTPTSLTAITTGATSYQWYSNSTNSNTGGTAIAGANSASYTPITTISGTVYYYVVASNSCGSTTSTATASVTTSAGSTCNAGTVAPVVN